MKPVNHSPLVLILSISCEQSTRSHLTPELTELTPFHKIHSVNCCVTSVYLRGDGRQRPLLKLTLCAPGWQMQTDSHTACSRLDCAAQSEWIRNRLIMTGTGGHGGARWQSTYLKKSHWCRIWTSNQIDGRFRVLCALTLRCIPSTPVCNCDW